MTRKEQNDIIAGLESTKPELPETQLQYPMMRYHTKLSQWEADVVVVGLALLRGDKKACKKFLKACGIEGRLKVNG